MEANESAAEEAAISKDLSAHLEIIKKVAAELKQRNAKAKRVFYPAGGYDAATPALLFPDALEIVVVDPAPFHRRESSSVDLEEGRQMMQAFALTGDVADRESIAGIIIKRLSLTVPGFRLRSIHSFKSTISEAGNGVIEFDSGPNTPARRYIHFQDYLGEEDFKSEWFTHLMTSGFDAVVVKGLEVKYFMSPQMKTEIYSELQRRHGLIIEDAMSASRDQIIGHLTGSENPLGMSRQPLFLQFGHGGAVLTEFHGKK